MDWNHAVALRRHAFLNVCGGCSVRISVFWQQTTDACRNPFKFISITPGKSGMPKDKVRVRQTQKNNTPSLEHLPCSAAQKMQRQGESNANAQKSCADSTLEHTIRSTTTPADCAHVGSLHYMKIDQDQYQIRIPIIPSRRLASLDKTSPAAAERRVMLT